MKATLGIALGTAGFVLTFLAIPALAEYTVTQREKRRGGTRTPLAHSDAA